MIVAVAVPFLNERETLPRFLDSVAAQTRAPDQLFLVDDGSTDGSGELAQAFAAEHGFARLLTRPPRDAERDRLATAKELEAFHWAVAQLDVEWDLAGKLDADLALTPRTLETIVSAFEADPRLGLAGSYLQEAGRRLRIGDGHVHGATKFFRRECWQEIGPVPEILGWDTIDEFSARMRGWKTQSFAMPDGDPEHLRPRGSHDGLLRGYRRWGSCSFALGESPLHVALYGGRQMATERPPVLGGLSYLAGYATAAARRVRRADPELRRYVRGEQKQRLRRRLFRS